MRATTFGRALVIASLFVSHHTANVVAEESALNLNLRKTYLKTDTSQITITAGWGTDAFTPTTVSCPNEPGQCVLRVEVSSQFEEVQSGSVVAMAVRVNGSDVPPGDELGVEVDSTSAGQYGNVRTFTWVKRLVPIGNHVVDVEFSMAGAEALAKAARRTLTIEVYKVPVLIGPVLP